MGKRQAVKTESEENILGSVSGEENKCLYAKVTRRACMELRAFSRGLGVCDSAISSFVADIRQGIEQGQKELTKLAISRAKKSKTLNKLDENGWAALHHATRYNRVEAVQELLENDAFVNIRSLQDGLTPLHIAARFGWNEVTKILLQHGADPTIQNENGYTPLHQACKQGNKHIVSLLLDAKNLDCNIKDTSKMTPLHMAAIQGDEQVCQMLMDKGADYRCQADDLTTPLHAAVVSGNNDAANVILERALAENPDPGVLFNVRDIDSHTILHLTALTNNTEIAGVILDHGASVNDTTSKMSTPLHLACAKGHMKMVKLLVEKKADVEARDSNGRTPLHICAQFNKTSILTHLLDRGAYIESRDFSNRTPLLAAAAAGQTEGMLMLISKGADVTAYDSSVKNCVHLAVENGNTKTLSLLLENQNCLENLNKADIRERVPLHYAAMCDDIQVLHALLNKQKRFVLHDENQKTPLHLACESGRAEQAKALAQASSSVNDRNDEGKTALHIAANCGHRKVCSKLMSLGADVNIRDNNRWTPLMFAAKSGSIKTCSDLLVNKASIDEFNNEGNSALLIATRSGQAGVVKVLMDGGASVTICDHEGGTLVEVAAKHGVYDVMMEICQHPRWKEVVAIKDRLGHPSMKLLIQHFPDAAKLIMNYCVQKEPRMNQSDPSYPVTYDFSLLDPGPDDPAGLRGHRYFGPLTMVHHNRQALLEHPLTQELLDQKWLSFGRFVFYFNFLIYIVFTSCFTSFLVMERAGLTFEKSGNVTIDPSNVFRKEKSFVARFSYLIILFAVVQLIKECVQIVLQGLSYFKDSSNFVEWLCYSTAIIFMAPYTVRNPVISIIYGKLLLPHNLWVSGVFSISACYMNLVLFMRRFRVTGIYVTMYMQVLKTILKAGALFSLFAVAFALVFYIMFKEQVQFRTVGHAFITVLAMMVGELQYVDTFVVLPGQESPMSFTGYFFCITFICIMSLAIMNLLIGLAVGDIDFIKRDATLKRLAMQVEFVSEIENKYPRFVTRQYYKPVVVTYPNRVTLKTRIRNVMFSMKVSAQKSSTEKFEDEHDRSLILYNKIKKTQKQVKSLVQVIEMQNHLLRSLAKKIDPEIDSMSMVEEDLVHVSQSLAGQQENVGNDEDDDDDRTDDLNNIRL